MIACEAGILGHFGGHVMMTIKDIMTFGEIGVMGLLCWVVYK